MTENSVLDRSLAGPVPSGPAASPGAAAPILAGQVMIVPAVEARRTDLAAIFGAAPVPAASGLVAYVDGVPVGWAAVQPRPQDLRARVPRIRRRARRDSGSGDAVWAFTSLAVRAGYRGRGLSYHLAKATIAFARDRGAHVIEADPAQIARCRDGAWGEPYVGATQVLTDAGFIRAGAHVPMLHVDFPQEPAGASAETPARSARC